MPRSRTGDLQTMSGCITLRNLGRSSRSKQIFSVRQATPIRLAFCSLFGLYLYTKHAVRQLFCQVQADDAYTDPFQEAASSLSGDRLGGTRRTRRIATVQQFPSLLGRMVNKHVPAVVSGSLCINTRNIAAPFR